ncbi:hypothetical protein pb186bvf_001471 [Paramecium bursaria]
MDQYINKKSVGKMKQYEKYEIFKKHNQNSQHIKKESFSSASKHPTVLSGKRNPNSESYQKSIQTSNIFKENTTPIKKCSQSRHTIASQMKHSESYSSHRTICPHSYQSPQTGSSQRINVRYNPNQESTEKEGRRILKQSQIKQLDHVNKEKQISITGSICLQALCKQGTLMRIINED